MSDKSEPLKSLFDLTGRVAIVTGGSRGLGFQMAEALGEYGATVILTARKQHELDAAVTQLTAQGAKAAAFAGDFSCVTAASSSCCLRAVRMTVAPYSPSASAI